MHTAARIPLSSLLIAALTAAAALSGCARTSVTNRSTSPTPVAATVPDVVYVMPFDLGAAAVKSDPRTLTGRPRLLNFRKQDPTDELENLGELLTSDLISDLRSAGFNAQRLPAGASRPARGWLVSGDLLELQEGNRLQKAVIGFGAGNSEAKLYVTVGDLAHPEARPLLDFNAESDGNTAPGGAAATVVTHSPWGMIAKFVVERDASEKDLKRVARQISQQIAAYAGKS